MVILADFAEHVGWLNNCGRHKEASIWINKCFRRGRERGDHHVYARIIECKSERSRRCLSCTATSPSVCQRHRVYASIRKVLD